VIRPETLSCEEYYRQFGCSKPSWLDLFWQELETDPSLTPEEREEVLALQTLQRLGCDYSPPLARQVFRGVQATGQDAFRKLNHHGEPNHEDVLRLKAWVRVRFGERQERLARMRAGTGSPEDYAVIRGDVRTMQGVDGDLKPVLHIVKQNNEQEVR
jgi:hypothetical protein